MAVNFRLLLVQIVGMFVVFALILFVAAGTVNWPGGWAFLILFFGFVVTLSAWLVRCNPALLTERMKGNFQAEQKGWDRIITLVANVLFLAWLLVMPLDAVRYQWSNVPGWLQVIGGVVLMATFYLFYRIFRENSFLSPVVKIQGERGHEVISTGPYHVVRHPMYATAILMLVAAALLMGSWCGVGVALVLGVAIARRAVMEEQTLREELPGYGEYAAHTRYRLLPGMW